MQREDIAIAFFGYPAWFFHRVALCIDIEISGSKCRGDAPPYSGMPADTATESEHGMPSSNLTPSG